MILHCNYEEVSALRAGARAYLESEHEPESPVVAPPDERIWVESVQERLTGDISIGTLEELNSLVQGVAAIVEFLRVEMEVTVAATHPADEGAVSAYFEFAHAYSVQARLTEMADEMRALVELMTGRAVTDEDVRSFIFPD